MKSDHEKPEHIKQRRSERRPVESVTTLRHPHWYNVEVTVCDVSQCGFMAECGEPLQIGSFVSLEVPGIGGVNAQVRWQIGRRLGGHVRRSDQPCQVRVDRRTGRAAAGARLSAADPRLWVFGSSLPRHVSVDKLKSALVRSTDML
jgi:hypothetical protein